MRYELNRPQLRRHSPLNMRGELFQLSTLHFDTRETTHTYLGSQEYLVLSTSTSGEAIFGLSQLPQSSEETEKTPTRVAPSVVHLVSTFYNESQNITARIDVFA